MLKKTLHKKLRNGKGFLIFFNDYYKNFQDLNVLLKDIRKILNKRLISTERYLWKYLKNQKAALQPIHT